MKSKCAVSKEKQNRKPEQNETVLQMQYALLPSNRLGLSFVV